MASQPPIVRTSSIAGLDAEGLQPVGKLADAVVELLVGDRAVVGLENDRDLVGPAVEVPVQAVVRNVEFAVTEPFEKRRIALVEGPGEGFVPEDVLPRQGRPEAFVVLLGLGAQGLVSEHARYVRLLDEIRRWRKKLAFPQDRFNGANAIRPSLF